MFFKRLKIKFQASHLLAESPVIPLVILMICYLPFLNKAFSVDDVLFIEAAKQIQADPLDFYGSSYNWYSTEMSMAEIFKNPPLTSYYIALVASFFGFSEIALHIAFLIPAAAVVIGIYYLAKQFGASPQLSSIAAVLTPVFMVSNTSVMCDTMMLALWVWAILIWIWAIKENKERWLFVSAILISACSLTKYFGIALIPLLFGYTIIKTKRAGIWILALLIPVSALIAYQLLTKSMYNHGLLADAAIYAKTENLIPLSELFSRPLITFSFVGGCLIVVLFYMPFICSRWQILTVNILTFCLIAGVVTKGSIGKFNIEDSGDFRWFFLLQFTLMVMTGIYILFLAFSDVWKSRDSDSILLLLWVIGVFVFTAFVNWTVNARSILPMLPAVAILLVRRIDRQNLQKKSALSFKHFMPLIPAAILVITVTYADSAWANSHRLAANEVSEDFSNSKNKVWFMGHWGFQYYMQKKGFLPLDIKKTRFSNGDIIIKPDNNTNLMDIPSWMAVPVDTYRIKAFPWLSTFDNSYGAGFYSHIWGPVPFVVAVVKPEEYTVWQIRR